MKSKKEPEFEHVLNPLVIANTKSKVEFHSLGRDGAIVRVVNLTLPTDEDTTAFPLNKSACQQVNKWFAGVVELIGA